ncbi:MAG: FAD/NAD(P)-binding protein [Magnetospirillum sp.]|nr:FAD/NAD(P)-binding protein [Magnetospirillum sp.]
MTLPKHSVAIAGGGFSGTALALYLLEAGGPGLTIHLAEPRPRLGEGIAYGDAGPMHLLNVPAQRMTLWTERPHDFLDWARHHGPRLGWPETAAATPTTFLPRRLFGHYVRARLERAALQARNSGGPLLVRHAERVVAATPIHQGFRLDFQSGTAIHAHQMVLATGLAPPALPFAIEGESHRLVADPWAGGALDRIGREDSILVIGTGLSMLDLIFSLESAGHRGEVLAASRHGLLPRVHAATEPAPPPLGESDARRGVVHCLRTFRRAVASGQAEWRGAMDGLRPVVDELWRAFAPAEQDRFLRHLRPFWEVHRHRMPAQSAELLLRRMAAHTLAVEPLRVLSLRLDRDGIEATLKPRGAAATRQQRFRWAINCTPPASPFRVPGLIATLAAAGLTRPHGSGLGVDVEADGTVRGEDGRPVPNLFALGPLRRGTAMETTSVPHIRPQVEALAARLLGRAAGTEHASTAQIQKGGNT